MAFNCSTGMNPASRPPSLPVSLGNVEDHGPQVDLGQGVRGDQIEVVSHVLGRVIQVGAVDQRDAAAGHLARPTGRPNARLRGQSRTGQRPGVAPAWSPRCGGWYCLKTSPGLAGNPVTPRE